MNGGAGERILSRWKTTAHRRELGAEMISRARYDVRGPHVQRVVGTVVGRVDGLDRLLFLLLECCGH